MGGSFPTVTRVAVYHTNTNITLESRPVRSPGPGELLMRVYASGICGSDILTWYREPRAPAVLGHEVAGAVVAIGADVEAFAVGDRIVATHHVPCLVCRYCLSGRETMCDMLRRTNFDPGGFSEWIRLPAPNVERGVLKVPDHVSDDAASFTEPLGCVLRAQRKLGIGQGDTVLIIGTGVSGCLHLLAAQAQGAGRIFTSDLDETRRTRALAIGADAAFDPAEPIAERIHEALGHGVDRVVLCTGARPAIEQAFQSVDRGGRVLFFAPMAPGEEYPLPFNGLFWRNDVTLTSSYGAGPADMARALDLIATRLPDLSELVTHRLPLAETQRGFALMLDGHESLKVVVDPRLDTVAS